jgi:hypothetical protein
LFCRQDMLQDVFQSSIIRRVWSNDKIGSFLPSQKRMLAPFLRSSKPTILGTILENVKSGRSPGPHLLRPLSSPRYPAASKRSILLMQVLVTTIRARYSLAKQKISSPTKIATVFSALAPDLTVLSQYKIADYLSFAR